MSDNRHPRIPKISEHSPDEQLGWTIDIEDTVDVEPGPLTMDEEIAPDSVRLQVKPSPSGYQMDMWWETAEGESRQTTEHLNFIDERVQLRQQRAND